MNNMNAKLCRFLAGSVFALAALVDLLSSREIMFENIVSMLANALLAVSLFANIVPLFAAGAGVHILGYLYTIAQMVPNLRYGIAVPLTYILSFMIMVGAYVCCIMFAVNKKKALTFSLIFALCMICAGFVQDLRYFIGFTGLTLRETVYQVISGLRYDLCMHMIPVILAGMFIQDSASKQPVAYRPGYGVPGQFPPAYGAPVQTPPAYTAPVQTPPVYTTPVQAVRPDHSEGLAQLQDLLDRGVITQEQYEEKKSQLLNS